MDISGVDIDHLRDDEIMELCGGNIENSEDDLSFLTGVDISSLENDKVEELYDEVMYKNNNGTNNLTDGDILNMNFNTVDIEEYQILLFNRYRFIV